MKVNRKFYGIFCLSLSAVLVLVAVSLDGCRHKGGDDYRLTGDTIADGKHLVKQYCTGCHAETAPDMLTRDVWRMHTLPSMAHYLKISTYGSDFYKKPEDTGGISIVNWQAIVNYYNKVAPVELKPAKAPAALQKGWAVFGLKKPQPVTNVSFTTMVAADTANSKIYTSDLVTTELTAWDKTLNGKQVAILPSAAVDAQFDKQKGAGNMLLSCIGRIDAVDYPSGRIVEVNSGTGNIKDVAGDLPRPVQILKADFDKDGRDEMVVCGQGFTKGGVYLYKMGDNQSVLKKDVITNRPGAVQALAQDFNKDGWTDLMVLYGTGNEGLSMYINDKKGGFITKELLQFPPVYGSTSFQLSDMDHDGNPDLIYTCGYNYHDSRILKPYHGLYIYKNTGNFNFKQQWFYPINGATKAIAADFDADGDLDIATTAFFADMKNNPAEECIYFEQVKPMHFTPHAIPVSQYGRWMNMQVADWNRDGKPDILLGNYASGFLFQPDFRPKWDEHLPFIILQNNRGGK